MALSNYPRIQATGITAAANEDILKNASILANIKKVFPNFPTMPAAMNVSLIFDTAELGVTVSVNDGLAQDILMNSVYETGGVIDISTMVVNKTGIKYTAIIDLE